MRRRPVLLEDVEEYAVENGMVIVLVRPDAAANLLGKWSEPLQVRLRPDSRHPLLYSMHARRLLPSRASEEDTGKRRTWISKALSR